MENWTPEQLQRHIEAGDKVFLKLWKKGCGACKLSIPALERLKASDQHGLMFAQISTDEYPEMLEISETDVLPAFFVFRDKQMAAQQIGFKGLKSLLDFVAHSMGEEPPSSSSGQDH